MAKNRKQAHQQQQIETKAGLMFGLGHADIVGLNSLGLICSRKCPGDVILKTYDFARLMQTSGTAIISGFHSPIEKDCLPTLLRGTCPIIIVQAHRLSTSKLPLEWQKGIEECRVLLISPFGEAQKRVTAELASERNRFVAEISDDVLIPYAHPGSKTEALSKELLSSGKRVYTFESPSNAALTSAGAIAVGSEFFSTPQGISVQIR